MTVLTTSSHEPFTSGDHAFSFFAVREGGDQCHIILSGGHSHESSIFGSKSSAADKKERSACKARCKESYKSATKQCKATYKECKNGPKHEKKTCKLACKKSSMDPFFSTSINSTERRLLLNDFL
jgi:hypothetical protein